MSNRSRLTVLTFRRAELVPWHRRASKGDPQAVTFFDELWADHPRPLECFIDGSEITDRPFAMIVPDGKGSTDVMVIPLCESCRQLPELKRWGRAIRLLKRMYPGSHYRLGE